MGHTGFSCTNRRFNHVPDRYGYRLSWESIVFNYWLAGRLIEVAVCLN